MRHVLTYSWQRHSICRHIIEVRAPLRSTFQGVGYWDTTWVFMAKLQLLLPGTSWPIIAVQAQLRSAIQTRMRFRDVYEANFDKLWIIMDDSLQPRYTSRATNKPPSTCIPVHSALFTFVCPIHIVFSPTLNQSMLCALIVFYQDTSHLSAGSSPRFALANISIYHWFVCEGCR